MNVVVIGLFQRFLPNRNTHYTQFQPPKNWGNAKKGGPICTGPPIV